MDKTGKSPSKLNRLVQNIFENQFSDLKFPLNSDIESGSDTVRSSFYSLSGYDFLNFISALSAKLLEIDFVYIAEFNAASNKIIVKAGVEKEVPVAASEVDIENKPVKDILQKKIICYPSNVSENFPDDELVKQHNIQGFAGVPLFGKSGDILGVFYAYSSKAIDDENLIESYMQLFSGRIASELNLIKKEELLDASEKKYKTLFETANDPIFFFKDMQIIDCNTKAPKIFGYQDKSEIIGKSVFDLSPEIQPDGSNSKEKVLHSLKDLENGIVKRYHWTHYRRDKSLFDVEVSLNPVEIENEVYIQAIVRDITEQKKIEDNLRESEERFQIIFEYAPDAIYLNDLKGNLLYGNRAAEELMGASRDEFIGKIFLEGILHPNDIPRAIKALEQNARGLKSGPHEYRVNTHDGEKVIEVSGYPVEINNEMVGLGIARDVTDRVRFEKELIKAKEIAEENERKLKESQRVAKIGTYEVDLKKGVYMGSDEAKHIMGIDVETDSFSIDEIQSLFVDREKISSMLADAWKNKDSYELEYDIVRPNTHEKRTISTIGKIHRDKNGVPIMVLGLVNDITEKKNIERELISAKEKAEENEKRLLESQRVAKIGHYSLDLRTGHFSVSPEAERIFGSDKTSVYDIDRWLSLVYPEDREKAIHYIQQEVVLDHSPHVLEYRIINGHTGNLLWIRAEGELRFNSDNKPVELFGTVQDITSQKLTELELISAKERAEENEIRVKAISENANDGITLTDKDGNYVFVNKAFSKMTKYSEKELLQMNAFDMVQYNPKNEHIRNNTKLNEEYSLQGSFVCKDNSLVDVDVHGKIIEILGETRALGVIRDITDKVKWENELIRAKERAVESDKLKTAFLLNVSHEIRTPMNGILGFISLLREPDLSDVEKSNYLEIVNKSGQRLMNTINDIVEISKIETGDINLVLQEIDISEVMQDHLEFFTLQANEKGLELKVKEQITGSQAIIKTDKHKVDGILMNLIRNAIKFTDKGKIEIGNYLENGKLYFYVSDTGKGIPESKHNTIFERFVQADTALTRGYEGSGLGLSIVKAHVKALKGDIFVKSEPGKGTTFLFNIKYVPVNTISVTKKREENSMPATSKATLLIAEDDEINFILMDKMLSKEFRLIHAENGEETVGLLRENPDVDLILMDIKMPGEYDGLEATRIIREFNMGIPIIAQTAFAQDLDKKRAIDAGCNDYISKPFNAVQLKSLIAKYCCHKDN